MANNPQHTAPPSGQSGPSPLVATAIGVVVGALIVVVGVWSGFVLAGDEAPIRVKQGSIDIQLLYAGKEWKQDGSSQNWKMKSGTRNSEDYELFIAPSNSASCTGGLNARGKIIRFVYSDGAFVQLRAQNFKTKLTANRDLAISQDGSTLTYQATGYISLIKVDTTDVCTFSQADSKLAVVLVDQ